MHDNISNYNTLKLLFFYFCNGIFRYSGIDEAEFFPAVLVGNKSDLSAKRAVSLEEVKLNTMIV